MWQQICNSVMVKSSFMNSSETLQIFAFEPTYWPLLNFSSRLVLQRLCSDVRVCPSKWCIMIPSFCLNSLKMVLCHFIYRANKFTLLTYAQWKIHIYWWLCDHLYNIAPLFYSEPGTSPVLEQSSTLVLTNNVVILWPFKYVLPENHMNFFLF